MDSAWGMITGTEKITTDMKTGLKIKLGTKQNTGQVQEHMIGLEKEMKIDEPVQVEGRRQQWD